MSREVVIERRFRGPPESANGGYACGLVAAELEPAPAVEVTLRAPPPLERELSLRRVDGGAELRDGELLIAEGRPAPAPEVTPPDPVSAEQAEEARRGSPLHRRHPFSGCFVCGPDRPGGDGMRIICGPVPGRARELVAAPWETDAWMADEDGAIREELVWSALDCPSGLAGMLVPGLGVSVLGRLTARLLRAPRAGEALIAIGWPLERDGRKLDTGSALLDPAGETLALAAATWIEISSETAYDAAAGG